LLQNLSLRMNTIVKAVCPHDCPDTCSMLVTVEDGRAIRMAGDPEHPVTQGFLCTKVAKYLERTYHDGRLLYPQIRVGAKGEGKFRRATWDEALELIASKLQHIIDTDGPQAILPYSYAGTMGFLQGESMDRRFFHRIGASLLDRTICASAGVEALNSTYGTRMAHEHAHLESASLAVHPQGQGERRHHDLHRSAAHAHRGCLR
jgi:anaerobic selenocysteine-containing dehydrogenase